MRVPRHLLRAPLSRAIAPHDQMYDAGNRAHYFGVGLSALLVIDAILRARLAVAGESAAPLEMLDYGCGCGRVTRFLRAAYPRARVWVTDLRTDDVAWVARHLQCTALPDGPPPADAFDLVWLGSVFTHLSRADAGALLQALLASLKPNGVLAFSTHGRFSQALLQRVDWTTGEPAPHLRYGLGREAVAELLAGYQATGYGYVDYPQQSGYGISIVDLRWYLETAFAAGDYTLLYAQERAYDAHQDVVAFMRRPVGAPRSLELIHAAKELLAATAGVPA